MTIMLLINKDFLLTFSKPKGIRLPIPIGFYQDGSIKELDVLDYLFIPKRFLFLLYYSR